MLFSENFLAQYIQDTSRSGQWNTISQHGLLTCATFQAACGAILQVLGPEWAQAQIGRSDKASNYFTAKQHNQHELLRYLLRVTEFGELIYNLHNVTGFEERLESLRTARDGTVESGIAELIAGKFFKTAGVGFQYVVVKPQAGQNTAKNPDIEYIAGLNRWESCEVKCNLQSTDLNERSINNSLKTAKDQLPKGKAGIILLRVPENWLADVANLAVIGDAVNKFLDRNKTTRVSSVFVFASETKFLSTEQMANVFEVKEFQNRYCVLRSGITIPSRAAATANWRLLSDFVTRALPT